MTATHTPGALKKFRRTPWRFQQTVEIPQGYPAHQKFAADIVTAHGAIRDATVIIDQVVFDTKHMAGLWPEKSPLPLIDDTSLSGTGEEVASLLAAALMDGPDFLFIPNPKPFVCYADHDQWITFFSNTKSHLNHIIEPIAARGYKLVQDWQREF